MKTRWKVLLSALLCLSLVAALVPSAAAATIVQGAKQVLLDENDVASKVYFEGVGEDLGLMVRSTYSEENGYQPGRCIEVYRLDASGNIVATAAPQVSEEDGEADTVPEYQLDYKDGNPVVVDRSGQVILSGGEKYYFSYMVDDLIWARDEETNKRGFLNLAGTPVTAFEDGYQYAGPIKNGYCSAAKYSEASEYLYGFIDLSTGSFFGSDTWIPLTDVSSAGMVWVNDGTENAARLVTIAELKNHSVTFIPNPEYDWYKYVIEEPVKAHIEQNEDQVFVLDDQEDNVEKGLGSNYERFQDLYFDDVKLVGGKVATPELSNADWDYYAIEGSTRLTVRSKVFANKTGVHQLTATFKSLDNEHETDTVTQYFEILGTKQEPTPVETPVTPPVETPVTPPVVTADPNGLKVNDVVNFIGNKHYETAYSTKAANCKPGLATVTRIYNKGTHNVHLIAVPGMGSTVFGWVDVSNIGTTQPAEPTEAAVATPTGDTVSFAKGDKVTVKSGARTYGGGSLAKYVYNNTYTVIQVQQDRVVIGINGVVTAAMRAEDLILAN